jgi:hypothetical protein
MVPLEAPGAKTVNDTIVAQRMQSRSCQHWNERHGFARNLRKEQGHWIVTPDYCLGQVCKRCYGTRQDHNWRGLLESRRRGNERQYDKERWILEDDRDQ